MPAAHFWIEQIPPFACTVVVVVATGFGSLQVIGLSTSQGTGGSGAVAVDDAVDDAVDVAVVEPD